jgi:hypothetical protein
MPGPLDDTFKYLTELSPQDWVVRGGWPAAPATVIDADIATVTGAADKVIRVAGPPDWLLSVDAQAGHDTLAKLADLLLYNSALFKRHGLPVRSLLVLLRREADSPRLTGLYERGFPGEPFDVALRYQIVRAWQVPAETWLAGGLGMVPLAPLRDVQPAQVPSVLAQMKQRIDREAPGREESLWWASYLMMGMRYEPALVATWLQGILNMDMKESATYQAILREGMAEGRAQGMAQGRAAGLTEGKVEEARKMLLLQGRNQFGEPPPEAVAALEALTDLGRLEELGVRLLRASSWKELLGLKGPSRRGRRRSS